MTRLLVLWYSGQFDSRGKWTLITDRVSFLLGRMQVRRESQNAIQRTFIKYTVTDVQLHNKSYVVGIWYFVSVCLRNTVAK